MQPLLPGLADPPPEGLVYQPSFLDPGEERALLARIGALEYGDFVMHGVVAKRKVIYFGYDYGTEKRDITRSEAELPGWILPLRERCAALAGRDAAALEQVLVAMYPPGSGVGWHRDAPPFGEVIGVSLGTGCSMRFRRYERAATPAATRVAARPRPGELELWLEPGSAYVLAGAARSAWQHAIPPVRTLRYSITFRTLRR